MHPDDLAKPQALMRHEGPQRPDPPKVFISGDGALPMSTLKSFPVPLTAHRVNRVTATRDLMIVRFARH
jgi:hypothetical protein